MFLEIEPEADFKADGTLIAEIVQAHFIIYRRFNRQVIVKVEAVAHFYGNLNVVAVLRIVNKFSACAHKDTVLVKVVASAQACGEIVGMFFVIVAHIGFHHKFICQENAGRSANIQTEAFIRTVR